VTTRPPSRRITTAAHYAHSPQFGDGAFRNPVRRPAMGLRKTLRILVDALWNKPADAVPPVAPPVLALTAAQLAAAPDHSLFRLGHSSLLVKLRGGWWITDPVFAERASPLPWLGPKRFHAPPIALDALPALRGVLLSHDHYDHLDRDAIRQLADKAEHFLAPLGVGDRLVAWGVDPARVRQFDWWEGTVIDGVQFIATPAQHFSGRGMFDGDSTLWASWTILDERPGEPGLRLFFSGDSGYFDGFAEIGRRYGPFDVTLVETGAYDAHWPLVHMQPEQTVQAHVDLRGRWLVPIHNGTFDLAMHPWTEPFERVSALAAARGIALATPRMGERLDLRAPQPTTAWWREVPARQPAPTGAALPAGAP
jgi:L-ascorbate metabolism protein UlaG (beta-lactamase superfamily)